MTGAPGRRSELEDLVGEAVRVMTAESNAIAALFSSRHDVATNDFRALLHVCVMQAKGEDVGPREIASFLGLSGGAVTYLAHRLGETGHLEQEAHPVDRRRVRYRYTEHGRDLARTFFTGFDKHVHDALRDATDEELEVATRVGQQMLAALRAFRAELDAEAAGAADD